MPFKKSTRDEAQIAGAWHLYKKEEHPDPDFSWDQAFDASDQGLTQSFKEVNIVLNDLGEEVEPPTKIWWD